MRDEGVAEETPADARVRASVTRTMVVIPFLAGLALLALAYLIAFAGDALGFFPFLLMLVGGLGLGFSFVNLTLEMVPARNGAVLHVAVAVVLGAMLAVVVEAGGEALAVLPEPARLAVVVLQMAGIPAAGWIWLGLISRVSSLFSRRDARKRPQPVPPVWEKAPSGDGTTVSFSGIPMRMRELTTTIVVITVVGGLLAVVLLIAFDDAVMRMGARIAIILFGVAIALPLYALFLWRLRRRALPCTVEWGNDELRLRTGDVEHVVLFRHLELLRWRARSDYARIEVRGSTGVDVSVVAGIAKAPPGRTAELPALPRRVYRRLELAGLTLEKDRRGEVVSFRR